MANKAVVIVNRVGGVVVKQVPPGVTVILQDDRSGEELIINGPHYEKSDPGQPTCFYCRLPLPDFPDSLKHYADIHDKTADEMVQAVSRSVARLYALRK